MATANNVMSEKIICLTLPHLCACPKAGHVIPMPYNVILFVFNDLREDVVVRFGGIESITV
jgi:hypothetical protein